MMRMHTLETIKAGWRLAERRRSTQLVKGFSGKRFVLTDPDLEFLPECPDNWLEHFWQLLDRHPVGKVTRDRLSVKRRLLRR